MNNEMKFEKNGLLIPNGALEELGLSGISLSAWLGQDHILLMPQEMTALQLLHALEGLSRASVELLGVLQEACRIRETQIHASFCRLYYKLKHQSIPILEQMLTSLQLIRNRRMLWSPDIVALNKRISDISSQNQTLAFLKQQGLVDPDIFIAKTNELTKQLQQAKLEKEKLMDAESDMTALQTRDLIDILEDGPEFLDSFDAELFAELVEKIIIESNDSVRFCLKNGLELRESIERTVR